MKSVVTEMIVAKFSANDTSPKTLFQWSPSNQIIYGPLKGKHLTSVNNKKSDCAFLQQCLIGASLFNLARGQFHKALKPKFVLKNAKKLWHLKEGPSLKSSGLYILTLESRRFPVLDSTRTLPNHFFHLYWLVHYQ